VASVTGGFLFGLASGTIYNVIAASLGAVAIFLAARWGLGRMLATRMETSEGKLKRLKEELHEHEISVLFLLRLVPVVPFFVANLAPAFLGARLWTFVWTTFLGIMPGTVVFISVGAGLGEQLERGERPDLGVIFEPHILGPLLGLAALAALPLIIKKLGLRKPS